jgi:lipoprotein-anchoring transpeptidase ErfK/SrfK
VLAVTLAVSVATATLAVEARNAAATDDAAYSATSARATRALAAARAQGYTAQDLAALQLALDHAAPAQPALPWLQGGRGQAQAELAARLAGLPGIEAAAMARHRASASARLNAAAAAVAAAEAAGADDEELAGIRQDLGGLTPGLAAAADPRAIDRLGADAVRLTGTAAAAGAAARAEQSRLRSAADALRARFQDNLDQLRAAGRAAAAPGRNDAAVAALLKAPSALHAAARIDHYGAMLAAGNPADVALGVAGLQEYQQQAHAALAGSLPHKAIVVSLFGQELWAYQDGKLVQDTLVTTGRPGLPTDVGAMKVLSKDSPWKMHSPWPKGSPHWYPDTAVRKVVWFTVTGEGLHDANWEPTSYYGPGGQNTSVASHGCIHVQDAAEDFLYDWADIGTPVIVYPGDGSPTAAQLAQTSVDDAGVPLTGPKGS